MCLSKSLVDQNFIESNQKAVYILDSTLIIFVGAFVGQSLKNENAGWRRATDLCLPKVMLLKLLHYTSSFKRPFKMSKS